jgi:DNA polymerase kappa
LANDLKRLDFSGRTITLKLKLDSYKPMTRAYTKSAHAFFSSYDDLYRIGTELLHHELATTGQTGSQENLRLRLMGLRVTNLRDELDRKEVAGLDQWAKPVSPDAKKRKRSAEPTDVRNAGVVELAIAPPKSPSPAHCLVSPSDQVLENVECPLCSRAFASTSVSQFNHHLDTCLDRACVLCRSSSIDAIEQRRTNLSSRKSTRRRP